jgi:hypothetical protein
MHPRSTLLFRLLVPVRLAACVIAGSVVAQASFQQAPPPIAEFVRETAQGAARWTLVGGAHGAVDLVRESLIDAGHSLTPGARATWIAGEPLTLAVADGLAVAPTDAADRWRVAVALHGGGERRLRVWDVVAGLDGGARVLGSCTIRRVGLGDREPRVQALDFASPSLVVREGASWIVADAATDAGPSLVSTRVVIAARLGAELDVAAPTEGSLVATGIDPRSVAIGDEVLVAMRRPSNAKEALGEARVGFFRSRDLRSWTEDRELSQALVATGDYSLTESGGVLWLATWSCPPQAEARLVVHRFDSEARRWQLDASASGARLEPERRSSPIWFLGASSSASARPRLAFRGASPQSLETR